MEPTSRLLDVQSLDTAIDRLNARRAALESEGELGAARVEAERSEQEFGELRLQLDTFDRDGSKLEHEIDSLTQKAADEESRLFGGAVANAKELESIRREVDNLRKRKAEREDELLELYDDLRAQKKGVGVAELIDGVCQGCHEKLSAVELDRIKHTEDVPRCEYCRRILVL